MLGSLGVPKSGMPLNLPATDFPNLTNQNHAITSAHRNVYNCIAWVVGDTVNWWWPIGRKGIAYWPPGIPREATIDAFNQAFATRGFVPCDNGTFQIGVQYENPERLNAN